MFEDFEDDCIVLGNFCYANEMILAISETCCQKPPTKLLLKMIYGLKKMFSEKFQDGCLVDRPL